MRDPSRIYRWTLLLASLLTIGYLVAAAVRENYLAEWQSVQRTYRDLLETRATDERGRELARNFRLELKQVSLPGLATVDRCVTCHNGIDDPRMTDVPNPHAVHPGNILQHHPVDRFGCTVCHQGQGPATSFPDAKAENAFWDYPLLPPDLTQSSCLTCHDVQRLPAAQVSLVQEGMKLYEEKSCASCHKIAGRGGILGPALDNEGLKTKHQLTMAKLDPPHTTWRWQQAHFRDPAAIVAGSQMKNPTVTERQARALTAYMLSLRKRDVPESYLAPDKIEQKFRALHPAPLTGDQSYRQFCQACHSDGSYGLWDRKFKRFIPAIRGASLLAVASREYLEANIQHGRPGTQMPGWGKQAGGLSAQEITALVDYLKAAAPAAAAITRTLSRGNAERGASLFLRNCAGCHGAGGRGGAAPEIGHPVFQQAATDSLIVHTIRQGRSDTAMPAFQPPGAAGLTDAEISDLLAYLRSVGQPHGAQAMAQTADNSNSVGGKR